MDMPLMVSKGAKNLIRFFVVIAFRVHPPIFSQKTLRIILN